MNGGKSSGSGPIHVDLLIEILLRLPAKAIARCRCVSKQWASTLALPHFTELFLTKSSARPRLLFAFKGYDSILFFSSPQPQNNPDEKNNSPAAVTVNYRTRFSFHRRYANICPVNGFFCFRSERIVRGRTNPLLELVICNPCTGQSFLLPKVKTMKRVGVHSYLGYDPIGKIYKVLSMTWLVNGRDVIFEEHQVLTLGTRKPEWRMIDCRRHHYVFQSKEICISGVLYYTAANDMYGEDSIVVCFDVRTEKFRFVDDVENFRVGTLVNYNGKLGSLVSSEGSSSVSRTSKSIMMYVLEDVEKQEWWKHTYVLPALWPSIVETNYFSFAGLTLTNEIVLSPSYTFGPFYVIYYNVDKKTAVKLQIQGVKPNMDRELLTFTDYVEDVTLMPQCFT
ncbi:PREDICTED: F-box protein DOR-like [Camelina sativa]|uniref:F-box protein DOR-like n=1 Tax=Camelina sativa TaxID=90675 RepID=A0ABM0ZB90_CAMSA|nr:PREDICTED: F-box protein DOR-like [Camelina sativa]